MELTREEGERGLRELDDFVVETLRALIRRERGLGVAEPTISHLARVDVGFIKGERGWNYFVNEVTRTPAISTWPGLQDEPRLEEMRRALVDGWLRCVSPR
jgi:hypothetical protein